MKKFIKKLGPAFALMRRSKEVSANATSLLNALSKILSRGQLEKLIASTPDRRLLIEAAARELKRSEAEVLGQIASLLGLEFILQVPNTFLPHLPAAVTIEELNRLGLVPLQQANFGRIILCTDPMQLKFSALAGVPCKILLAPWSVILSQLQLLSAQLNASESSARKLSENSLSIKVLEAVVNECRKFHADSCQLFLAGNSPKYSFRTIDGRSGSGTIDPRMTLGLVAALKQSSQFPNIEIEQLGPNEFTMRWQNYRSDNVIPLPRSAALAETAEPKLPEQDTAPLPPCSNVKLSPPKPRREVMIVEDNPTFTRVLDRFLQKIDVNTSIFSSVEAALAALANLNCLPDVIVADLHLPGKGGDDLIATVRSIPHLENIGIIVLTSDDSCDAELKTIRLGADAFIGKNQDPRILCAHVERILNKAVRRAA